MNKKWRIERAGVAALGYDDGWFAIDPLTEMSKWFPTQPEALEYAIEQLTSYGVGVA
jgi:hypothetical protein